MNAIYLLFVGQVSTGQANMDPAPEEAHSRKPSGKNPSQGQETQHTIAVQSRKTFVGLTNSFIPKLSNIS